VRRRPDRVKTPLVSDAARPTRTAIVQLKLTSFRNYGRLSLDLDGRSVVLTGANGAGKTNLLEAVSFLSPGRGLRRAKLDAVARQPGAGSWAVAATVANTSRKIDLGTGISLTADGPDTRRSLRVDHTPARTIDALLDYLRVLWLTPAMDGLFTGPASDRRRFLDRAVFAIDKLHGTRVNAYEKAMRGRNRLLVDATPNAAWLTAIEAEMAELAVAIAAARREWAGHAVALIAAGRDDSPFPFAEIELGGWMEHALAERSAGEAEDRFCRALRDERPRASGAGRTLVGPHLSDLHVRHGPKEMAAENCSTGEQKALLIGLVLAQARLAAQLTDETPVVLLDEIAAHLDEARREALYTIIEDLGCQAFMTGTDAVAFASLGDNAQQFAVGDSKVTPVA